MNEYKILDDRYEIYFDFQTDSTLYRLHKANDLDGYSFLVKVWPFKDSNMDYFRALWNSELRKLYRISSSPGVDAGLLTIRDAGFDKLNSSFILVMKSTSEGYERLSEYMAKRSAVEWLKRENLIRREIRISIWRALYNLAEGIRKLHLQGIIHRNISSDAIFFNHVLEPDSMRLGGFEWSIRLGEQVQNTSDIHIENSIDSKEQYGFRQDWKAFGNLILDILNLSDTKREINYLLAAEIEVLEMLESSEEADAFSLIGSLEKAINALRTFNNGGIVFLDLVINPGSEAFMNKIKDAGFLLDDVGEEFSPVNRKHVTALKRFIQKDLDDGQLLIASGASDGLFILIGKINNYVIKSNDSYRSAPWDSAYLLNLTEFRSKDGNDTRILENARVRVAVSSDMRALGREPSINWKDYLPVFSPSYQGRKEIRKFQNFLRATNQLELFFRINEIFTVSVINYSYIDGVEKLILEEVPPSNRRTAGHIRIPEMCQHFWLEWTSGRRNYNKVILTDNSSLKVSYYDQKIWEIDEVEPENKRIFIKRLSDNRDVFEKGKELFIRTVGHYGQMQLILRRKHAIQKLDDHSYLLKAISQTGQVYIDTKINTTLRKSTIKDVDESKVAVIQDVIRTRPIYALQGPPGTGKTTLVAHLVRELIEEDPMVQILVTAQAHGAVDVLRQKINKDAFKDVSDRDKPISIRIGKRTEDGKDFDHVEEVAKRILNEAASVLISKPSNSELIRKWKQLLSERNDENVRFVNDFQELIKRSAMITYSTAMSADLAELADGNDEFDWTFDWSIVEEAGKAHGFDLALPLQTGHRWLLLGDHKQLPPHLFNEFLKMIQRLDEVNDALDKYGKSSGAQDYIDIDWLREWSNWDEKERNEFRDYSKVRLNLFRYIFESLKNSVFGKEYLTHYQPEGALAGILTTQYRMHPIIGDMISTVFYDNQIKSGTMDANNKPNKELITKLKYNGNNIMNMAVKESPIIWIDMPDAMNNDEFKDSGKNSTEAPYVNRSEVKVLRKFLEGISTDRTDEELSMALLAPYNSQTRLMREEIKTIEFPQFLKPVRNVYERDMSKTKWIHTVDSFQGNEADIVVVSLVRNNTQADIWKAIGFLADESRMNVLLSRGRKKLILIGSFGFFRRQIDHLQDGDLESTLFLKRLLDYIQKGIGKNESAIVPYTALDNQEAK